MAFDNTNRGTLGRNKRREKDSHPEYTGSLNVDGNNYWLSAWVKESNGEKFFSVSVKPKEGKPELPEPVRVDPNDDIPF